MSEREQAARKRCYGEPKFILYQVGRKAHKKASESAWRALKEGMARVLEAYVEAAAKTGGGSEVR
jgi:hypothetical protein